MSRSTDIFDTSAKALALDNGLAEAHASRGLALSLGKRYDEATAEFEQAIALDPNSFEAHYFYGRACFTLGKLERAAELFERAAEIKPDDYQSLILLIQIYRSLGRDADRKSAARRGVERAETDLILHPDNPRPAYLGSAALVELGDNDRAREWLSRALAIDPRRCLDPIQRGLHLYEPGRHRSGVGFTGTCAPARRSRDETWMDQARLRSRPSARPPRYQKILELIG